MSRLPSTTPNPATSPQSTAKRLKKFLISLLILGWLLPIVPVGLDYANSAQVLSAPIAWFYHIGCLFPQRVTRWSRVYVEGERQDGTWIEIDYHRYFRLKPFGYRKRLTRVVQGFFNNKTILSDLATYVRETYNSEKKNQRDTIKTIRFVTVSYYFSRTRPFPWPKLVETPRELRNIVFDERNPWLNPQELNEQSRPHNQQTEQVSRNNSESKSPTFPGCSSSQNQEARPGCDLQS